LLNTPAELDVPVPVVAISAHGTEPNVTHIVLDHVRAVELALRHLYDLGHRRIAFMRGPKVIPDSEFRWAGVEQAAQKLSLELDPRLVTRIDSSSWSMKTGHHPMSPEIGYEPMKQLLARTRDFTSIFCFNDIAAIGAIRALKEAGLDVPGDVSVVGFDDIQSAAFYTPSLTTVRQPLNEMGKRGARLLLERIANPTAVELIAEVVMQPELVVRESTGVARP
jgi:LacI family transcriptional regulator